MGTLAENTESAVRARLSAVEALRSYSREEKNGVTHIYFYIGPSWFAHGLGALTLGVANIGMEAAFAIAGHNNKYFDSDTGEYLGNGQDAAVQTLFRQGQQYCTKGEYDKGATYFKKAYNYCPRGYSEEATFKSKWEEAERQAREKADERRQAEIQRQVEDQRQAEEKRKAEEAKKEEERRLAEEKRKIEEKKKAEEAKKLEDKRQAEEAVMRKEKEKAVINEEAEKEKRKGMEFWKAGNYKEAKGCFQDALLLCTDDYGGRGTFEKNIALAEDKLKEMAELERIKREKDEMLKKEKMREAEQNQNLGANQNAELTCQKGMKHWNEGQYQEAQHCFEQALLQCSQEYGGRTRFEKNVEVAKWKIVDLTRSAEEKRRLVAARKMEAMQEASRMFEKSRENWKEAWSAEMDGDEEEAGRKFGEVQRNLETICKHFCYVGEYERYREMVQFKIRGDECFNDGIESEGKGCDALEKDRRREAAGQFEKSLGKLLEAKLFFEKGYEKGERMFGECVQTALESIEGMKVALGQLDSLEVEHALDELVVGEVDGRRGDWNDEKGAQQQSNEYQFQVGR